MRKMLYCLLLMFCIGCTKIVGELESFTVNNYTIQNTHYVSIKMKNYNKNILIQTDKKENDLMKEYTPMIGKNIVVIDSIISTFVREQN